MVISIGTPARCTNCSVNCAQADSEWCEDCMWDHAQHRFEIGGVTFDILAPVELGTSRHSGSSSYKVVRSDTTFTPTFVRLVSAQAYVALQSPNAPERRLARIARELAL